MSVLGVAIFALTYLLVAARRLQVFGLDRPTAALLGAVACVALGVLSPKQALGAISGATILLLFSVMGMGAFLAVDGVFDEVETRLVNWARTPARLLACVVWGAGLLSALLTNDAVCVLAAPTLVRMIQTHHLPALPFLLALATGSNTGSVATLVGNPQNMLCGLLGHLSFAEYLAIMAPVAILALAVNHLMLWLYYRGVLPKTALVSTATSRGLSTRAQLSLLVVVGTSVAYTLGVDLAWTATAGFVVLMVIHREMSSVWTRIDWTVLLFFAGLFVVVGGLIASGAPAYAFAHYPLNTATTSGLSMVRLSAIFLVGSNIVTNVPFILVVQEQVSAMSNPEMGWTLLAMVSTFAGNLTLLGSLANVIVAESARDIGGLGFRQHLRFGLPLAVLTTGLGTLWLWLTLALWT